MYFSRMIGIVSISCIGLTHSLNKRCVKSMDLPVVPLHRHPQYMMECCRLINSEWPRSETARLRSLECSADTLPTCLILLKDNKVIGHCKLSLIPAIPDGCFIESVVIEKGLRCQGYGKYLMEKVEQYCQEFLNLRIIYLSTKGQELFYMKIGYSICEPVSIYGSYIPRNQILNKNISNDVQIIPKNLNSKVYMCKTL